MKTNEPSNGQSEKEIQEEKKEEIYEKPSSTAVETATTAAAEANLTREKKNEIEWVLIETQASERKNHSWH